jgi:hypothetical protein
MLPAYNDCPRRATARQFRGEIEKAGYFLNQELPSIGAAVGTATHAVAEAYFISRISLENYSEQEAVEKALQALREETGKGCNWDDTTPSIDAAEKQIRRMASAYIQELGINIKPVATEMRITADLEDGWELSGQIDLLAEDGNGNLWLRDLKTGAVSRSHHAQLGAYSLLYRSAPPEGFPKEIKSGAIDFIKRTPKTRPQDSVKTTEYDLPLCEKTAWATIQRIKKNMQDFQSTRDIDCFPENPMSMLCNKTYCIAHGTNFCPITMEKK